MHLECRNYIMRFRRWFNTTRVGKLALSAAIFTVLSVGMVAGYSSWSSSTSQSTTLAAATVAAPTVTATSVGGWGSPTHISGAGAIIAISCPTATMCMAVYGIGGGVYQFIEWNGTSWGGAVYIAAIAGTYNMSISCPTTSMCMAGNNYSEVSVWNGTSWSVSGVGGARYGISAVSCPTATTCYIGDGGGDTFEWNGGTWTELMGGPGLNYGIYSISCPTTSMCMAVGGNPNTTTEWNGTTWTTNGGPISSIMSISCPLSNLCWAITDAGNALEWNGTTWTSTNIDGTQYIYTISCPTTSMCMAGDQSGNAVQYISNTTIQITQPTQNDITTNQAIASTESVSVGPSSTGPWTSLGNLALSSGTASLTTGSAPAGDYYNVVAGTSTGWTSSPTVGLIP